MPRVPAALLASGAELRAGEPAYRDAEESFTDEASQNRVRPTAKFFSCKVPLSGTPDALSQALPAPGSEPAIRRPLPGQARALYDYLVDCL